jgi:hypothetical protein
MVRLVAQFFETGRESAGWKYRMILKELSMRWLFIILAVAGLDFHGGAWAGATLSEQSLLARAEALVEENNFSAINDFEPSALKASGGRAIRKGSKLSLRLRNNRVVDYVNSPECKSDEPLINVSCQTVSLIAYIPSAGRFLYYSYYDENNTFWFVGDNDGTEVQFNAVPLFSPNHEYFLLIYKDDPKFGYSLVIMRSSGREYIIDWQGNPRHKDKEPDYRFLRWKENDKVCVTAESDMYCMVHFANGWKVTGLKNVMTH